MTLLNTAQLEQLKVEYDQEKYSNVPVNDEDESLFDETPEEDYGPPQFNPDLKEWEIEDALWIVANLFPAKRAVGLILMTGEVGSGKDLFGNVYSWKMKHYFGKTIHRDEKPRELYGFYKPFNEIALLNWVGQMRVQDKQFNKWSLTRMLDYWLNTVGEKQLLNSVLYLTEFHKWMYNRASHSPIDILMGRIIKRMRHLNCLIFGTTPQYNELDFKNCLQYVNKLVRCRRDRKQEDICRYTIAPVKFNISKWRLLPDGDSTFTFIDGERPREHLNGRSYFNLYNSKSRTVR